MKYRRLGRTELQVSVVGLGAWQFGGEWGAVFSAEKVREIVEAAREEGINLIDTAECYGDHLSERLIGKAIKGERDKWIVATKFGHLFTGFLEREDRWSAEDVRKQLEDSLRALDVEYVDLYQFHSGNREVFDNEDLWSMLDLQVRAGKVRHLGISVPAKDHETACYQAERAAEVGAAAIQVVYNRLESNPEQEVLPSCQRLDLGVLARVPLASGFLSGKYKTDVRFDASDVRARRNREEIDRILQEVEQIRTREVPEGVPMAEWALAWCLSHPAVTAVIPGCRSAEQVRQNAAASELEI